MPPKKRSSRAAHHQQPQPVVQSDYDTDTAALTDNASSVPIAAPPKRTNTELNLTVLRRYVPDIERIVQIAPFAVLYTFSTETGGWEKSGTEGTLFVCQLHGARHPRYSVVILNRKSLDNFVLELVSSEDVDVADDFVILQVPADEDGGVPQVYGLWIFSDEQTSGPSTMEIIAMSIQECAVRAEEGRKLAAGENGHALEEEQGGYAEDEATYEQPYEASGPEPEMAQTGGPAHQQAPQPVDLLSLFGKSQVQPESHIAEPTPPPAQQQPVNQQPDLLSLFQQPQARAPMHTQVAAQPPQTQYQAPQQQQGGQQLDLLQLFGKAQPSATQPQPQAPPAQQPQQYQQQVQQPRFASNADTDFFRTSHSPAQMQHPQAQAPPSQQNALLDLFKR